MMRNKCIQIDYIQFSPLRDVEQVVESCSPQSTGYMGYLDRRSGEIKRDLRNMGFVSVDFQRGSHDTLAKTPKNESILLSVEKFIREDKEKDLREELFLTLFWSKQESEDNNGDS